MVEGQEVAENVANALGKIFFDCRRFAALQSETRIARISTNLGGEEPQMDSDERRFRLQLAQVGFAQIREIRG